MDNTIVEERNDGTKFIRFKPTSASQTGYEMELLCKNYNEIIKNSDVEPLFLIGEFILIFLCIHPFNDGNGRMSRLLTLLLLYKSGYTVGKYISVEKMIEKTKEMYYESLHKSSIG
jgi:Fic family protein